MDPEGSSTYDIAIIGGGPVGLTTSILLSLRGIKNVLFERHSDTSIHPKACGINQRTTEIFRIAGIEKEVYGHAAPAEIASRTAWYTSLGPSGSEIASRDAWGGGVYEEEYKRNSPSRYCILPQIRLEPILKRRAIELNPTGIKYSSEVTGITQHKDHVMLIVQQGSSSVKHAAKYAIVADGGRSFTDALGVQWLGERNIFNMVTSHFKSPLLRSLHPDPRNFITWFINPSMGGSTGTGFLYQIGPWPSASPSDEEWVFVCALTAQDPERFTQDTMTRRLRQTLQIPDLEVEMQSFSHWNVNAIYAERYRVDRVFLVGDAAHRIPPWGALGMNTGIQDAQNLVWKLQFALEDEAKYAGLLDTYDDERKPVGKRVGLSSLHNLRSHAGVMDVALGLGPENSVDENRRNMESAFDKGHPEYAAKRAAIERAQKTLDLEFKAPGAEVGWFYPCMDTQDEGGPTLHQGQLLGDGELNSEFYVPSTIPGHFVPHAWLRRGGERCAVLDLVPLDRLLLIARSCREAWEELGDKRVRVEVIGEDGWIDVDGAWERLCGVSQDGAVLVRPDGMVAWRGERGEMDSEVWRRLIDSILHAG
ncbi:hypothetical protein BU26DRAFT_520657 [Trematosphaeria pertusa]|uniref:FAD-binding domain-containing protein n=1 Tax=Trematosphaeria pertusa TaxID=390896 RepID=A0A6A6IBT3_9PLEO|nr:uncharacterized protein BU26DRAFT_520657 [Trematosphaeria pertusa]KAF2247528.1 hypothetical protein BU26DRAFT_520657 [Trematosphaeria pertusa]